MCVELRPKAWEGWRGEGRDCVHILLRRDVRND